MIFNPIWIGILYLLSDTGMIVFTFAWTALAVAYIKNRYKRGKYD